MFLKLVAREAKTIWYYQIKRRLTKHVLHLKFSDIECQYSDVSLKILENFNFAEWKKGTDKTARLVFITFLDDLQEISIIADCDIYLLNDTGETVDIINKV